MERIKINHIHRDKFTRAAVINTQLKKASYALIDIEADFLEELFDENNSKSYADLYNEYCFKYEEVAKLWSNKTCEIIDIKVDYFENHYFPLEG